MKKTDVWKKAAAAGLAGLLAVGTMTGCSAKTDTKEAGGSCGETLHKRQGGRKGHGGRYGRWRHSDSGILDGGRNHTQRF